MTTIPEKLSWLGETDRILALLNAGFPPVHEMAAAQARAAVNARVRPADNLDDVASAEDLVIERSLRARLYTPHRKARVPAPAIVYLHGGGFVFCSIESHDGFCRRMSRHTGSVVLSVDYRLAPESVAPAAARDAFSAYLWVRENASRLDIDARAILVAGDSAGGNLAAVVSLMARDLGKRMPAGQVLLYPVIEPRFDTPSYRAYATGHFNTEAAMRWYWRQYLGRDHLPRRPERVAPSKAPDHSGLPPAIVYVPARDPLASEGNAYADTLRKAGVKVRHRFFPDLFHGFVTIAGFGPAATAQEMLWSDIGNLIAGAQA